MMDETDKQLVLEQLSVYGLMKFPKDFMNISEKTFSWVYENRTQWVEFSVKWKNATGLFKFWYLYVKLRRSLVKNDKPSNGKNPKDGSDPVFTLPMVDK